MKLARTLIAFALLLGLTRFAAAEEKPQPRSIELCICLDTSGSMQGLIESAKQKLWAVVNDLATAKPTPTLRVALYHYGNDGLDRNTGWVQQLCPLTEDLDTIYGKLFPLRTNGGTEYVARVMHVAATELKWSNDKNTLKIMVIAGNEPATQDTQIKLQDACKASATAGIIVNTIFCGPEQEGRQTGWEDASRWADGRYAAIDHNSGTVVIATPYDKELAELSSQINTTYVRYGSGGGAGHANQTAQDANASSLGYAAAAERATSKGGKLYRNESWDLVDASKQAEFDLKKVKEEELPAEMKGMTPEQREVYVKEQSKKREDIQKRIQELSTKRDQAVKDEMQKKGLDEKSAFDTALRQAIREQAQKKNFSFEQK